MSAVQTREAQFAHLILPHRASLLRAACRSTRSREEAEDVVQETLFVAFRYLDTFYGVNARPWLNTILRHQLINAFRKHKSSGRGWTVSLTAAIDSFGEIANVRGGGATSVLGTIGAHVNKPETALQFKEEIATVRAAIADLPDTYRRAIVLFDIEGWSYEDIASEIGIPIGTVRSRLSRARRRVRDAVAAHFDQDKASRRLPAKPRRPSA